MSRKKVSCYYLSNDSTQAERIKHALNLLELDGVLGSFLQLSEETIRNHKTPLDFLEGILELEIVLKEDSRIQRWIQQARFSKKKTLKDFDFSFKPNLNQTLIYELGSGRFIEESRNIVFLGPPGVGKTHLSIAIGIEVIAKGYDVRFIDLEDLIKQIIKCDGDILRLQRMLTSLLRPKLLILDDIDYYTMREEEKEFLFKLIMQRYDNHTSMIFTSNKDFDQWEGLFGQKERAAAAIDRITGNVEIIEIDGMSYRLKDKVDIDQVVF